jgi:hypothetical protein
MPGFSRRFLFEQGARATLPALWPGKGGALTTRPWTEFRKPMGDLFERFFGQSVLPLDGDDEEVRAWDFDGDGKETEVVVKAEVPCFEPSEIDVPPHQRLPDEQSGGEAEERRRGELPERSPHGLACMRRQGRPGHGDLPEPGAGVAPSQDGSEQGQAH